MKLAKGIGPLDVVVALSLLIGTGFASYYISKGQNPPHPREIQRVWLDNARLKPGEPLVLNLLVKMHQTCTATKVNWSIIEFDGVKEKVVFLGLATGQSTAKGVNPIINLVREVKPLPLGKYAYRGIVYDKCEDGREYSTLTPYVYFEIAD